MELRDQSSSKMSLPNPNSFNHYNLPTVPQPNLQQSSSSGRKLVHGRNESAPTANQVPLNRAPYLLQTLNSQSPDEEDEEEVEEEEEEELNPDPDPDVVVAVPAPSNSPTVTALAAANSENQNPQSIRYRECRKNHAANLGSHVLDGCGEFMPGGEEGTPQFLKCAACDCHRNFHRKESDAGPNFRYGSARTAIVHPVQAPPQRYSNNYNRHHHQSRRGPPPQVMLGFGGDAGAPAESSSEDLDALRSYHQQQQPSGQKKRFRTKFSEGQKERMLGFAEKLGWKIQKQDEEEVQQFCSDIGVKRKVFKVWMHNNKQSMEKKKKTTPPPPPPPL